MKNKKYIYCIFIVFLMLFMLFSSRNFCYASITESLIDAMDPMSTTATDPTKDSRILVIIAQAFSVVQFIGTGISIIVVMYLGITYMISSIEEKAEIKKRAIPIVIGSVLIVATVNILKLIQEIVTDSL